MSETSETDIYTNHTLMPNLHLSVCDARLPAVEEEAGSI